MLGLEAFEPDAELERFGRRPRAGPAEAREGLDRFDTRRLHVEAEEDLALSELGKPGGARYRALEESATVPGIDGPGRRTDSINYEVELVSAAK
jgi:hypothetical protein